MFKKLAKKFFKEEDGAGMLEYLIIAAVIGLIAVLVFPKFREYIAKWFSKMMENVNKALGIGGGIEGDIDIEDGNWD